MKSQFEECPKCHGILEDDGSCSCGYHVKRQVKNSKEIDRNCPFNDHGYVCGKPGSISPTTNGHGPWYDSEHWWMIQGKSKASDKPRLSYRERWYSDRGLPYEPPRKGNLAEKLPEKVREPGEDEDFIFDSSF